MTWPEYQARARQLAIDFDKLGDDGYANYWDMIVCDIHDDFPDTEIESAPIIDELHKAELHLHALQLINEGAGSAAAGR